MKSIKFIFESGKADNILKALLSVLFTILFSISAYSGVLKTVSVGSQGAPVTYSYAASPPYLISGTMNGSGSVSFNFTITFSSGTPTGVTTSFSPQSGSTSNVNNMSTLTINTTAATPAGTYSFTLHETNNSYTAGGSLIVSAGNLPVTWLNLDAAVDNKSILISWSTASEINNNYFTVEKATDGFSYNTVGVLNGAGNSTEVHNYQLSDQSASTGVSYYRVKQTDNDGKNSYSRVVAVSFTNNEQGDVRFFPNPATDKIYINLPVVQNDRYMLHVFDFKGTEALKPVEAIPQKNNLFTVDMSTLANGIYTLQLISGLEIKWLKVVKE